ncbi:YdeI/OmpD-associated family protein [Salinimicrobium gaetbulicola]|uniref:YdeI family protein n=1 Tax=Salinimicrobium gaetbulicola TaxID=999702 RepID=A0ABW3IJ41_9FLAO
MAVKNVDEYILRHVEWEEEIKALRKMILSTDLEETIKWGGPVYTHHGKNVVGIGAFKNHCALWFFQGALLEENTAMLTNAQEGKTKALRQIKFEKGEDLPLKDLKKYVKEAIKNQKAGKEIKPETGKEVEIPALLNTAFENDSDLKTAFFELTAGKQRDYCQYIDDARQDSTKLNRLEKITPMIKSGVGINDKYKK